MCSRFVSGLDPRLLTAFRRNFPKHSDIQLLDAAHQQKVLQEMLKAAQSAEDDLIATQRIAREAVGLSQAFHANSQGRGGLKNPIVGVYPSQTEDTIQRYASGGGQSTDGSASTPGGDRRGRRPFACHGCGGPHPWTETQNGEHVVVCPNQNNPGKSNNAKRNIDRMKVNRQKCHRQNTKHKNLGTANYSDFDAAGQERIREQSLSPSRMAITRSATPPASRHP